MNRTIRIARGQRLPGLSLSPWRAGDRSLIDFSTGYTFTADLVARRDGTVTPITGAIVGFDGGVTVDFGTGDTDLPYGTTHVLWVTATEISTGRPRVYRPGLPPIIKIAWDNRVVP